MKLALPLHRWPAGRYQNAATHADDSTKFRARQAQRMTEAAAAREAQVRHVVTPIKKGNK